ncbi:MAG: hypothetical protein ABI361_08480 [Nitrososphaera sp.]
MPGSPGGIPPKESRTASGGAGDGPDDHIDSLRGPIARTIRCHLASRGTDIANRGSVYAAVEGLIGPGAEMIIDDIFDDLSKEPPSGKHSGK